MLETGKVALAPHCSSGWVSWGGFCETNPLCLSAISAELHPLYYRGCDNILIQVALLDQLWLCECRGFPETNCRIVNLLAAIYTPTKRTITQSKPYNVYKDRLSSCADLFLFRTVVKVNDQPSHEATIPPTNTTQKTNVVRTIVQIIHTLRFYY